MTVITITTIGYGEIVDLSQNPAGRVFYYVDRFLGSGLPTTSFQYHRAQLRRLKKSLEEQDGERTSTIEKHYIICSAEDVGFYVANELHTTQRPYVIVEAETRHRKRASKAFQRSLSIRYDATG